MTKRFTATNDRARCRAAYSFAFFEDCPPDGYSPKLCR